MRCFILLTFSAACAQVQSEHPWLWKAPGEELHSARSRLSLMSPRTPRTPAINKFKKAVGGVIATHRMGGLNMGLGLVSRESKLLNATPRFDALTPGLIDGQIGA